MRFDLVPNEEFFDLLYEDSEFCEGVGRVMLAAGILELRLRRYLHSRGITVELRSSLGAMVATLKRKELLTRNGEMHFDDLVLKRNYLAHSLYSLFRGEIEETILENQGLAREDTDMFSYRAHQLAKDFLHFADTVESADSTADVLL